MKINDEWFAGELEADNMRIVTRMRLFSDPVMPLYPYRIEVQWLYKGDGDAMPIPQEAEQIDRVFDLLTTALEEKQVALLTTIHLGAKQAIYQYYTANLDNFSQLLDATLGSLPPLPINIGAERDAEWKAYKELLQKFGM